MRVLLLIAVLAFPAQDRDWKLIEEMSGDIPNHPGLTAEWYAAEIARGDNLVKLLIKAEFPWGAPRFEGATYPTGFDPSSISRIEMKVEFNCDTLKFKPVKGSSEVYQFNGKHLKSKEVPFPLDAGHVFVRYFCERGDKPTKAPTLKPK